jgi:hypothetical protein
LGRAEREVGPSKALYFYVMNKGNMGAWKGVMALGALAAGLACQSLFAQGALDELEVEILVPPGGLNPDGTSAELPVMPGDLLFSLVQTPTAMFASVMNEDLEYVWAAQSPFRGFYMKPWKPGQFVWYNYVLRKWTVVDMDLNPVDTLTQTFEADDDYHDVMLLDDGTYMVMLLEHLTMDLTSLGGEPNAEVLNPYLVHLDSNETVLNEWSGIEALPLDPNIDVLDFGTVDHLHWNSMQFDAHGGLLLSFRNRSQIVRLRPEDWSIHWKLGGEENMFELTDPEWEGFNMQHDAHDLGDGRILLFDNALFNENGTLSRALELALDTVNFTAERVWQFAHPEGVYGAAQGSAIRLENGNTLIGWGTAGTPFNGTRVSEVTPEGDIAMELRFAPGTNLYRARKYPVDLLVGCRDTLAVNYSPSPWIVAPQTCLFDVDEDGDGVTDLDGDCDDANPDIYPGAYDVPNDGIDQDCDGVDAVGGCLDLTALNYNPAATVPDGSCTFSVVVKVDLALEVAANAALSPEEVVMLLTTESDPLFEEASTLVPTATAWQVAQFEVVLQEGTYFYRWMIPGQEELWVREGVVAAGMPDSDWGVVCFNDDEPCPGCTDFMDVAFNPAAMPDPSACQGPVVAGCTYVDAVNYNASANLDDGSCVFETTNECPGDFDQDGSITVSDLLELLVAIGTTCG